MMATWPRVPAQADRSAVSRSSRSACVALCALTLLTVASLREANAQTCDGGYSKFRWQVDQNTYIDCDNQCDTVVWVWQDFYNCADTLFVSGNISGPFCPCDDIGKFHLAIRPDGSVITDSCQGGCPSSGSPSQCNARDPNPLNPLQLPLHNAGCGGDERSCSRGSADSDGAPVRFSSGRVETNPITVFQVPAPDEIFFGFRLQWGSHVKQLRPQTRIPSESEPTIHSADETTHFLGVPRASNVSIRELTFA